LFSIHLIITKGHRQIETQQELAV